MTFIHVQDVKQTLFHVQKFTAQTKPLSFSRLPNQHCFLVFFHYNITSVKFTDEAMKLRKILNKLKLIRMYLLMFV